MLLDRNEIGGFPGATLDVVIPVFNEERNIPLLLERLAKLQQRTKPTKTRVIFVDDHSTDNSPQLLKKACVMNEDFHYLRLSRNSGSHISILAGLEHAKGDCAVFLASDLQDPPELILEMIDVWHEGSEVVWAVRADREGISWLEKFFSETTYQLLNRFSHLEFPPRGSDFALLDRKVVNALVKAVAATPSLGGEIPRLGFRPARIQYKKEKRQYGKSKWVLEKKLKAFSDAFTAFSYMPLRLILYAGIVLSSLGFLYALVVIFIRLVVDNPVEGWTSLMVAVLFIGGIQMIMIGILGEYLWRTLEEARTRPRYFIEEAYPSSENRTEQNMAGVSESDAPG